MKFIHLSDLHFRKDSENNKAATTTLEHIRKQYPAHKLIITGDIVDDGHEEQSINLYPIAASQIWSSSPFFTIILFCTPSASENC